MTSRFYLLTPHIPPLVSGFRRWGTSPSNYDIRDDTTFLVFYHADGMIEARTNLVDKKRFLSLYRNLFSLSIFGVIHTAIQPLLVVTFDLPDNSNSDDILRHLYDQNT